jgi:3-methyl-2-oxobutanoate hydroxymethyltransferase
MLDPRHEKITLWGLRAARESGEKIPMLTCYDFTMARLMQEAGVPTLLVGDSAANVILGHPTTLPVSLDFMIDITAAVRRGAPNVFLVADMPFGSYQASVAQGVENVCAMVKRTGCDMVKLEADGEHLPLVRALGGAGIAVMAHLGLRPQAVGVLGGYKYQGRTAKDAQEIVALSLRMEEAGASAILLEAVPPEVSNAVVTATGVPVIGCGAGPACHGCVMVTHDALGLTSHRPRFVPILAELASGFGDAFSRYVKEVREQAYPAAEHQYSMPEAQAAKLRSWMNERNKE